MTSVGQERGVVGIGSVLPMQLVVNGMRDVAGDWLSRQIPFSWCGRKQEESDRLLVWKTGLD
ncbi:uncharacterized protein B0T23DRAFT_233342 [Neurospora hispaniola]|uniref:Uncharacterized protein n=1 Tax=Neurospora hispaniola TaxID=588809 RepID=A0AAJ0I116_9PEZI|nr:hypothetical protein B0T23DRAFT_233342 [Neurospora hispaniola]